MGTTSRGPDERRNLTEVWLYLAGGIGIAYAFGVALSIGVAAGVVRRLRGR